MLVFKVSKNTDVYLENLRHKLKSDFISQISVTNWINQIE